MCCRSCNAPLKSLDSRGAVINGVIQIISGVISIAFASAAVDYIQNNYIPGATTFEIGSGIWSGVLILVSGLLMLFAGLKQGLCCTVAALVFAVFNVTVAIFHFFTIFTGVLESYSQLHCWQLLDPDWPRDPFDDCSDKKYRIAMFLVSVLVLAAFAQMLSVIWAIVLTSKALHRRHKDPAAEVHRNTHARSNWLKYNWIGQMISTNVSVLLTFIVLFIVAYGVGSGSHDHRSLFLQKAAASLWCAPVYFITVYLGYRSWTLGENSSLISFLVMNLIQVVLCPWELAMSATAIGGSGSLSMAVVNLTRDQWGTHYEPEEDGWRFQGPLITLHSLIIISSSLHFLLSVAGIVTASMAAHRDGTCSCGTGCCCCGNACCCRGGCCGNGCCGSAGCCSCEERAGDPTSIPCVVTAAAVNAGGQADAPRYVLVPVDAAGQIVAAGSIHSTA